MSPKTVPQDRTEQPAPYDRLRTLLESELYSRVRTLLLGGPGLTVVIDPNEAPLLFDARAVISALERAAEEIFPNYATSVRDAERRRTMERCTHVQHTAGGNDYMECLDCGIQWDWRRETPEAAVAHFVRPS